MDKMYTCIILLYPAYMCTCIYIYIWLPHIDIQFQGTSGHQFWFILKHLVFNPVLCTRMGRKVSWSKGSVTTGPLRAVRVGRSRLVSETFHRAHAWHLVWFRTIAAMCAAFIRIQERCLLVQGCFVSNTVHSKIFKNHIPKFHSFGKGDCRIAVNVLLGMQLQVVFHAN